MTSAGMDKKLRQSIEAAAVPVLQWRAFGGHAAEPPSTCFASPPLRSGRFAVTASRRRGVLPTAFFGVRCGQTAVIAHQRTRVADSHRRAEQSRLARSCARPAQQVALTASTPMAALTVAGYAHRRAN